MPATSTTTERTVELPATAAAAWIARRELAGTPGLGGKLGYKALLLTSELVAAFVADEEPRPDRVLRLSVSVGRERVRVEVAGDAPGVATGTLLRSRETPSLGGYGLQIVERMADAWGTSTEGGSAIWFELTR